MAYTPFTKPVKKSSKPIKINANQRKKRKEKFKEKTEFIYEANTISPQKSHLINFVEKKENFSLSPPFTFHGFLFHTVIIERIIKVLRRKNSFNLVQKTKCPFFLGFLLTFFLNMSIFLSPIYSCLEIKMRKFQFICLGNFILPFFQFFSVSMINENPQRRKVFLFFVSCWLPRGL